MLQRIDLFLFLQNVMSHLFLRVVGSSGRSYIFKFEVPFLVLPQNKSWTEQNFEIKFQDRGWGLIIYLLQQFSMKAFPRKSCHKSENDTSHLVFNVK